MTNIQNLGAIIVKLMEEEQEAKKAVKIAKACELTTLGWVEGIEELAISNPDEWKKTLDESIKDYDELCKATWKAEQQLETIQEALEALRKAAEAIAWLSL